MSVTPIRRAADEVARLNDDHAMILLGDKPVILREYVDRDGRPAFRLISLSGWHEWMRTHTVVKEDRRSPVSKLWCAWPGRREYEGLTFAPQEETPMEYNLWRGFAVEPDPDAGGCQRLIEHIFENVAQGDAELGAWIVGWFASLVQAPREKTGTSLVLKGPQGTGKTVVGRAMGSLLGEHYQLVSDPRYLTGRFNAHVVSCLLLQLDEATWGGDHQAAGKLKDLITGDWQLVEYKGKEAIKVRNYLRLLITGNSEWLVPAGLEERRFAVAEMGEGQRQNHDYFARIEAELSGGRRPNGGRQALLAYLLDYDLSDIAVRTIPETAALAEQKLASLPSEGQWWIDVLMDGRLPGDREGTGVTSRSVLYDSYIEHARRIGTARRSIEVAVGNFLTRVAGPATLRRTLVVGGKGPRRMRVYEFPSLAECRRRWDRRGVGRTGWPDDGGEWLADEQDEGAR